MDGGDNETRRRGACDLLRGMCKHYEEPTTRICSAFVAGMYQEYSANREANWRSKDAAVSYLMGGSGEDLCTAGLGFGAQLCLYWWAGSGDGGWGVVSCMVSCCMYSSTFFCMYVYPPLLACPLSCETRLVPPQLRRVPATPLRVLVEASR